MQGSQSSVRVNEVAAPRGVSVFEVAVDGQDANVTQFLPVANQVQELRQMSWPVTMVVVSDDLAFLAIFAEWSLKGHLLVWSTRFLFLTYLPIHRLQNIHNALAITNSMLIVLTHSPKLRGDAYVVLPYTSSKTQPLSVAFWSSEKGLTIHSAFTSYTDKFSKFPYRPRLPVGRVLIPLYEQTTVDDLDAPGETKIIGHTPEVYLLETLGDDMNFAIKYITPADGQWGVELPDGSWTGMIGQLVKKEVVISVGTFTMTPQRNTVVSFTHPATVYFSQIIAARGSPEIDPWGFFLPLTPLVWTSILASLLGVLLVMTLLLSCLPVNMKRGCLTYTDRLVRVLLQQDVSLFVGWWWWERVALGVWMLMTLVLTRSYTGNLMSQLAVRYIPQPLQTLQDVVIYPVTILINKGTSDEQAFRTATSGVMQDVWNLREQDRVRLIGMEELNQVPSILGRGQAAYLALSNGARLTMSNEYARTGTCEFYLGRGRYLPSLEALAVAKGSPLLPNINRKVLQVVEAGLYEYWFRMVNPNFTICLNAPKKVAVMSTLNLRNLWGVFVVIAGGGIASLIMFCLEVLFSHSQQLRNI